MTMALWERSQIHVSGFKFKTHTVRMAEFKLLSLFYDLKQQFKQSLCQSI